ncbi:MAG: choice-of-anchor R domain-containing protein, partial [Chloroflexaceae bacterium]
MKLTTIFWGDDLLFEGDLSLILRMLPVGARITRAVATLAPAASALHPKQLFEEVFPIDSNGRGPFGLLIQQESTPVATVVALGARRSVQRLTVAGVGTTVPTGAFVQIDMGGLWMGVDRSGNLTSDNTADRRSYPASSDGSLALPGLASERFRLSHADPATTTAIGVQQVTIRSYPTNLQLRLGDLGPVWFRLGDLRDPVSTPDFAAMLDAFLQRSQPEDGVYLVPFTLHSDSLARLRVSLALEYHLEQRLLPPQLSQAVFPYAYGALPEAAPVPLAAHLPLNARAIPGATRVELSGRFANSRVVHGPLRATTVADSVAIAAGQTLAHPIRLSVPTLVDALDLHVEATTATASLLVTLQEDVGGKPWGPSLFSEPVKLELARPAAGGRRWASAPFATPFTFQPDTTYWLVVTAAEGEVQWAVEPVAGLALQRTRDAGLSYRQVRSERLNAPVAGIYRLRVTPTRFRQPLKLTVAEHEVSLRDYDALGKVAFRLDLPAAAEAIDAALNDAASSRAARGQRIVNGDFSAWTRHARRGRRDATPPLSLPSFTPRTSLSVRPDGAMLYLGVSVASSGSEAPQSGIQAVINSAPLRLGAHLPLQTVVNGNKVTINPLAIAVAPDGVLAYGAGLVDDTNQPVLFRVDLRSGALLATLDLATPLEPVFLAVDPACRYLYLATRTPASASITAGAAVTLHRLPAAFNAETTLEPLPIAESAQSPDSMLIAPDGRRAYLAVDGRIELVDLERWQRLGSLPRRLSGMALSPDGARLYVLQARRQDPQVLEVVAFDTRRLETLLARTGAPQQVTPTTEPAAGIGMVGLSQLSRGSFSRDSLAPAVLGVAIIDDQAHSFPLWLPMLATPDDSRLLVVSARRAHAEAPAHWQLHMVDTAGYRLHETLALAARPLDLAVVPDSRRAVVLTVSDAQLPEAQLQALELDA